MRQDFNSTLIIPLLIIKNYLMLQFQLVALPDFTFIVSCFFLLQKDECSWGSWQTIHQEGILLTEFLNSIVLVDWVTIKSMGEWMILKLNAYWKLVILDQGTPTVSELYGRCWFKEMVAMKVKYFIYSQKSLQGKSLSPTEETWEIYRGTSEGL